MPAVAKISELRRGEAGRAGDDVRSDLHVSFAERNSGGIEIGLRSRVELYYGEVIRRQVRDVLRALGVEHAFIEIVDEGALPFMIAARIEAAVRRAGLPPSSEVELCTDLKISSEAYYWYSQRPVMVSLDSVCPSEDDRGEQTPDR